MNRRRIAAAALAATLLTTIAAGCDDEGETATAPVDDEITAAQAPFTIPDKSQARVADFWNAERMRAAVPYEVDDAARAAEDGAEYPDDQTACVLDAKACTNGEGGYAYTRGPGDPGTVPGRMVGKLFFTKSGRPYECSGSVVEAENRSVVWTAGHCVADRGKFHSNWIFVPAYRDGAAPYGRWVPRGGGSSIALTRWIDARNGRYDLAAVVLATDGEQAIADRVGALPIVFDQAPEPGQPVRILGYPGKPPFDGSDLEQCTGQVAERDEPPYINDTGDGSSTAADPAEPSGYRVGCDLTPGSSGGPFLLGPPDDGTGGSVFSVVSSGPVTAATGSYQGELARALWQKAQTFE
jgi:Trypsin-like peptidase domain